ncbi:hypothetical protein [Flavobacterium sp.]|uniref:hypothetical protein n=1 Tax=Flavobacterium sp. TaxID=239 RepID=UPI0033416EF2
MKYLEHIDKFFIEFIALIIFVIGYIIIQKKQNFKLTLQYCLYSYGIAILLLSLTIPSIFPGYPEDISDLENKKRLLYHLQRNNEALVQTTEAIRQMALLTFALLLTIISNVIKHFKIENSAK